MKNNVYKSYQNSKNHTHVKKGGASQNFFLAFVDELDKKLFIKKLLKWDNKNVRILIFANVVFKKKTKKKHQDISFYTCVPKILMI